MSDKWRWRPIDIALFAALAIILLLIALGVFDGGWA